ncbi:hypothetical protein [Hymenobacter aerophilus]|uniref:hypothetical protein n=1 Tax=Hymenobacter aerophilus TaxID=119644 RepID=UPI000369EC4F|nr:hypothetical protein [Hymenobacter aerophilus]
MSTQKTNQPGDSAAKHVSFTPAQHEDGGSASLPTGQAAGDNTDRSQQPQGAQGSSNSSGRQQQNQSGQQSGSEEGLEAKAKAWFSQQQWLQNVDVNQLSKQAKDLGSKAVEQVNRLTPTQKVVGGALLVSGLSWLALRSKSSKGETYRGSSAYDGNDEDTWNRSEESVYRGRTTKD